MLEGAEPLTEPISHGNCPNCEWKNVCHDELEKAEHISLIAGVVKANVKALASIGVRTQTELAKLDVHSAVEYDNAHAAKVDLVAFRRLAGDSADPSASVSTLTGRSKKALEYLQRAGYLTVGDLLGLDTRLADMRWFADVARRIDSARVLLHPDGLPHIPRGAEVPSVPRADIEIDVDMENSNVVYLWGTNSTIREGVSVPESVVAGYRPFHCLAEGHTDEAEAFVAFWEWMHTVIADCHRKNLTVRFYCYSNAEKTKMHEAVARWPHFPGMPTHEAIDQFCATDSWVDLKKNVESLIWPTDGLGLKKVAPLAGFSWRDEDAGGDNSILWYEIVVTTDDESQRREMSEKLLRYNEDDVLATKVLREWLDDGLNGRGPVFRNVTELDDLYE
jgi:predicted RecB family nuclease